MVFAGLIAWLAPLAEYQDFLLLIGSVFAPLFGVVLVDHYLLRRRYCAACAARGPALGDTAGVGMRHDYLPRAGKRLAGGRGQPAGAVSVWRTAAVAEPLRSRYGRYAGFTIASSSS